MWPFNRSKKSDDAHLPDEVQEYYRSQSREGKDIAILIGAASLVITVLLALAVFYGGRWTYRRIFNHPDKNAPAEVSNTSNTVNTGETKSENSGDSSTGSSTGNTTPDTSTPATTSQSSTPAGAATSSGSRLPNTGPDADL